MLGNQEPEKKYLEEARNKEANKRLYMWEDNKSYQVRWLHQEQS